MNIALLVLSAIALVAGGAGATYMLASVLPQHILQRAQNHGRFAGLTADDHEEVPGKRARPEAPARAYTRHLAG
jgi:hypothetical protein